MGATWQGQCGSQRFEMVWIFGAADLQRTAESYSHPSCHHVIMDCICFQMSPVLNVALEYRFLRAFQEHRGSFLSFLCTKSSWLAGVSFALASESGAEAGLEG